MSLVAKNLLNFMAMFSPSHIIGLQYHKSNGCSQKHMIKNQVNQQGRTPGITVDLSFSAAQDLQ